VRWTPESASCAETLQVTEVELAVTSTLLVVKSRFVRIGASVSNCAIAGAPTIKNRSDGMNEPRISATDAPL
jgi:hypothetical protein